MNKDFWMPVFIAAFALVFLAASLGSGCTVLDKIGTVTAEGIIKHCEVNTSITRELLRHELARECQDLAGKPCGIAVQCPGESWNDVDPHD